LVANSFDPPNRTSSSVAARASNHSCSCPVLAHACGGQRLFTGTIAKVASLVAIVIGGYGFAHGEPGAKKALAGVAAGTGIAVLAVNVLSWLWGV
jgi:type IV secretory pathway VirB2 component (pilin)